nr:hypothetical protein [uncultured Carboxylicivirga sp.]
MDLGQRKTAMRQLTDASQLEADKALLQSLKPHSRVLKTKYPTSERTQREVLWDLLEVASLDDIKANRSKANESKPMDDEVAKQKAAEEAELKALEKDESKQKVLSLDLEQKIDYQELKHLVATLEIETADRKAVTLLAALVEFKAANTQLPPADNNEKVSEGTGEEMEEVKGALEEKENKLEEKTAELEDTKEELEQTQEQLEEKTAELEAEKKSEAKN